MLHIFDEAIDTQNSDREESIFEHLCKFMRKEIGVDKLAKGYSDKVEFTRWFVEHTDIDELLDAVEHICRMIKFFTKKASYNDEFEKLKRYIPEINARFFESSVGYQFENGNLIQADSQISHKEIVVPALHLLREPKFAAAEHEFLDAFSALRNGDYEISLIEACKSLESTIKVIGSAKGWVVDESWLLKRLVQAVFENNLIPPYMQSEFTGLRTIFENGVGTVRNKQGGHGAGKSKRNVPRYLAAFQIHQTAAAIIFLVEAAKEQ